MRGFSGRVIPSLAVMAMLPAIAAAQTFFIQGNNPNFDPYTDIPCALGDGFVARADTTEIQVWLVGNDAQNTGRLSFVNPRTGADRFLFRNKDEAMEGVRISLGRFPKGAPIVFKYVNENDPPKYSGLNEPGTYEFDADPALRILAVNGQPKPVSPETNDFGDHRWAISGRVNAREVVFAFDDVANGDFDYNDVVFVVSGVALNSEVKLPKPILSGVGDFNPAVTVSIAVPPTVDAPYVLYYTVDGSDPRVDTARGLPLGSTRIYSGAFDIADETTVIARIWKAPLTDSGGGVRTFLASDTALMRFVPLRTRVLSAAYLDESGDGRIDAARIRFDIRPPRLPADVALRSPFPPGAELTLPQARIAASPAPGDTSTAYVRFADQPFPFGTGFAAGPYGRFPTPSVLFGTAPFPIVDSVGPVLVKADALKSASGLRQLRVIFSEPVTVQQASQAFPFALKRLIGSDPNGRMTVSEVRKVDDLTYEWVFAAGTTHYPVPGDSLKLQGTPTLTDTPGTASNMAYFIPVGGPVEIVEADIVARGGGWVVGSELVDPKPLGIPVGVIPGSVLTPNPPCLECRDPAWKNRDPARPAGLPAGPLITVSAQAPFSFDVAFYTNLGGFVNRAAGDVTETMLAGAPLDSLGRKVVSLMWYPVSRDGHQAGSGAYIARGTLAIQPGLRTGPQGERISVTGRATNISVKVGYLRK